jgi:Viral BACON domain/Reeler domain
MSTLKLESTAPVAGHWPSIDSGNSAERRRWRSIRKSQVLATIFIAAVLALPLVMIAYPTGAPAGYTGAPASSVDSGSDCTSCHGGTAQTAGLSITGFGSGNTYTPGAVEHLTVTLPASTSRHGFEFTARSASSTGTGEGALASTDSTTQVLSGGLFITHTNGSAANTFNFDWTPPATNVGNIIFYAAGVNGYSNVIKTNLTLTPSGGGGAPPPTLGVSPISLSFAYQIGGATPAAQNLSITSTGAALSFTAAASGGTWLSASPASGTTPGSVSVSVNPAGLAAGTYNGSVAIAASGAGNSPQRVAVTFTVTPAPLPNLTVSPTSLSFSAQAGGAAPAAQSVSVGSSGAALNFTAGASGGAWLAASPGSGTTLGRVSVSVNPAGLAAGTYNGSVAIAASGAGNSPQTVAVTLTVTPAAVPNLTVSPTGLSFTAQAGGAAPSAQLISVGSSGVALNFTAAAPGGTWLAASPGSGTTPGSVSVSVNPAGLAAGTYNGSVAIEASGAGNSPQTVAVTLTVTAAPPPSGGGLTVTPTAVSFSATVSGADPAAQALSVQAASSTRFRASASGASGGVTWLSISPSGRLTTNQNIAVTVAAAGLAAGTYTGSISLRVSRGEDSYITTTVPVTLVVAPLTLSLVR